MASCVPVRLILVTGPPGVGKTTIIQKVCTALKDNNISVQGFYTEEVRIGGRRTGFDVVTLNGNRGQLARVGDGSELPGLKQQEPRVGQYNVKLKSFEQTALPVLHFPQTLSETSPVLVIDEIGKMELFSRNFVQVVRSLVSQKDICILATIPIAKGRPIPLVEELKNRRDAEVFVISKDNRNSILLDIVTSLKNARKIQSPK